MTVREAWLQSADWLAANGVEEDRSNAELLLLHALGIDRAKLLLLWNEPFPADQREQWKQLLRRKAAGEPIQYIVGEQWFCGRPFDMTPAVLIPRPETELLAEAVLEAADRLWPEAAGAGAAGRGQAAGPASRDAAGRGQAEPARCGGQAADSASGDAAGRGQAAEPVSGDAAGRGQAAEPVSGDAAGRLAETAVNAGETAGIDAAVRRTASGPTVLDVGTGSGAIAVTLAAQRRGWRVCASDLSPDALEVARRNAARHEAADRMTFLQGDLLAPILPGGEGEHIGVALDVLVSNPPYIPAADMPGLQREVRDFEPHLALVGGADGLDPYRRMLGQLRQLGRMPRIVAFELGIGQPRIVAELMHRLGAWDEIRIVNDYAGIERHIIAVRNQP